MWPAVRLATLALGNGAIPPITAALGMWGTALSVFLLIALLAALLRRDQRRKLRVPFLLMLAWAVGAIFWNLPFMSEGVREWSELVALISLDLAAVRAGWLLVVDWGLKGGATLGLSQISRDLIQASIYIVTTIAAARAAGADPQALATTGGLVTAGLTFSLQQTLSDLVAGLLLQAQAPFRVGDWIAYDDNGEHIGQVSEINWRATKIVTSARVELTVPNSVLAKASIVNYHEPALATRRSIDFEVSYDVAPRRVQRAVLDALRGTDGVLENPAAGCEVAVFNDSGVRYRLKYYLTDVARREEIDSNARTRLWYGLKRAGIDFVYPRLEIAQFESAPVRPEVARGPDEFERVEILAPLSTSERRTLAERARVQEFTPGEFVVREGDKSTEFYVVASGELAVIASAGRHEQEIARLSHGDVFGEMALLTGEPRAASVRALTDCVLYVIDKPTFQSVVAGNQAVIAEITQIVARRQAEIVDRRSGAEETGEQRALREASLLTRMRIFFGGKDEH